MRACTSVDVSSQASAGERSQNPLLLQPTYTEPGFNHEILARFVYSRDTTSTMQHEIFARPSLASQRLAVLCAVAAKVLWAVVKP